MNGDLRRREIIRKAADIFYQKGYAQTSTKDIAEAVGILKGSLYAHISSKEDILYAIIQDVHSIFESSMSASRASDAGPLDRLRIFLNGHMQVALSELKFHQIYTRDWRSLSEDRYLSIRAKRDEYERYLAGLLEKAQKAGLVRADADCRLLAMSILAALNSVHFWYRADGEFSAATVADAYCSMVLEGIVQRADRDALRAYNSLPRSAARRARRPWG
jgi:TetR/AcrR family transcriptional regulator, cholesterol catabolism regulator